MARRFARVGRFRRSGGGGGGSGGGGLSQLPPLPSGSIAAWHSELSCTPAAWVDYIGARSMVGTGTPVVAADPGFFNGRQVAQAAQSGKSWSGTFAALALTGTRPWVYCVARSRTLDATSRNLIVVSGGGIELGLLRNRNTNASATWNAAASVVAAAAGDTNAHKFSTWLDGVNISFKLDAPIATNIYAPALSADITTVTVGTSPLAGGREHDVSVAYLLIAAAKPAAAAESALDAWSLAYWGV